MSWRIYTGFKLKNIKTLEKALVYFKSKAASFDEISNEHWKQLVVTYAIANMDNTYTENKNNEPISKNYLGIAKNLMWEQERESMKDNTKSITNSSISIGIAPVKIAGKNELVGILFSDNHKQRDAFFSLDEIEDYSFFDSTDRPEDISAKEWKQRENIWGKKIFNQSTMAAKSMFTLALVTEIESLRFVDITQEDIDKYTPSLEERIKGALNHIGLASAGDIKKMSEYFAYMRSEEFIAKCEEEKPRVEQILIKNVTLDILSGIK